jgi:hypothetical protein
MYKTQKDLVLSYLEKNKTITTFECFEELQIVDLQKAIQLLRKEGYNITDKWFVNENTGRKFKRYKLEV